MNWFYLIPIIGAIGMLFIDPWTLVVVAIGLALIVGASFLMEKLFGPPKNKV